MFPKVMGFLAEVPHCINKYQFILFYFYLRGQSESIFSLLPYMLRKQ